MKTPSAPIASVGASHVATMPPEATVAVRNAMQAETDEWLSAVVIDTSRSEASVNLEKALSASVPTVAAGALEERFHTVAVCNKDQGPRIQGLLL